VPDTASAKASAPVSHQVVTGETLYAIARKYAVDLESLQRLNKLESPVVKLGQVLLIPSVVKPVSNPEVKPVVTVKPIVSSKPVEAKPVETKPVSSNPKPAEVKPVEPKPVESKPVVSKPISSKPVEAKPVVSTKPAETKPIEVKPVEVKPVSSNPKPAEASKPAPTPTVSPKPIISAPKPVLKPVSLGGSSASGKPVRAVSVGKFVVDQGSSRALPKMPSLGAANPSTELVNTSPWPNLEGAPGQPKTSEPDVITPAVQTPEVRPSVPSSNPAGATRIPIKVVQSAPLPDLGPITGPITNSDSSTDGITPTHSTDPTGNGPDGEAVVSTTGPISAGGTIQYTVVYGDSLYRISVKYGLTVEAIKAANNLTSDSLAVGQILNIPGENLVSTVMPPSSAPLSGTTTGAGLRTVAERYLGVTYVFGGTTPNGLDCSGLVYLVYQELGLQLPRTSRLQYQVGEEISRADLREGDLVFFDTTGQGVSHVGIYLEDGDFINAASNPGKVLISNLSESYWDKRYLGARRVITSPIPSDQPGEDVQP
jgi:cell wall-associated NlpC family hydrolase